MDLSAINPVLLIASLMVSATPIPVNQTVWVTFKVFKSTLNSFDDGNESLK